MGREKTKMPPAQIQPKPISAQICYGHQLQFQGPMPNLIWAPNLHSGPSFADQPIWASLFTIHRPNPNWAPINPKPN
jgi:hypothetical protein